MNANLLFTFIGLNIANVIIQTAKSIITVKAGKIPAALANAIAYGLYTIVTIYMLCDLPLFWKAGIVAVCNLIGVYIVKLIEEKSRKDKLWKVEVTIPTQHTCDVDYALRAIPHSYINISSKHTLFNFYCARQEDSRRVREVVKQYDARYFVAESKTL